jgi:biotin transport system substrate-specific component
MTSLSATHPTLLNTLAPGNSLIRSAGFAIAGSLLLALSAKAQVPFWPVPMTLQSLVIMMLGMTYGSRLAMATVLLYLTEGLAGLPVFAGAGAGFAYMTGPTAGYLVGFVAAAGLIGWLAEHGWDRSPVKALVAMSVGHALLFIPGVAWLAVLFGTEKAIAVGLTPFIAATLLKTALGAALMQAAWTVVSRRSQDRIDP